MTELYVLEEIDSLELSSLLKNKSSEFIAFDYVSHKQLSEKNINHKLIDDFLTDLERREIFENNDNYLQKIENYKDSDLMFHGINFVNLIDRNELREFLMNIVPKIKVINKVLQTNEYSKIFLPYSIYNIFSNSKFKEKVDLIKSNQNEFTSFEKIEIPIKIGFLEKKITIGRKKYKTIKNSIEKSFGSFLGLRKSDGKKIVLLEFNPETFHILIKEINKSNFKPVLINFRKSPIYNFKTISILRQSKSIIMIPEDWLGNKELNEFKTNHEKFLNEINKIIRNKKNLLNFEYDEINFSSFIQKKLNQLLIQRFDEYIMQILIAESIQSQNDVKSIVSLNLSGETEKVFSKVGGKVPILHLQHAFSNYVESISYLDVLDDFDFIRDKIAVWGDVVRDYLINVKNIDSSKIFVTGSPKYDLFKTNLKQKTNKKIILVTLRPIILHVEGPRISLFDKYEKTLQKLIQITKNYSDIEIIFKLHPQQNSSNDFIKNLITPNEKIKFYQHEPISELLQNCDLHVNIATDNFDASSVILEAMLFKKPTLNIQLQQNIVEFEFIKDKAIKTIDCDSDFLNEIIELLDKKNSEDLMNKSQKYLSRYIKNRDMASHELINLIKKIS